MYYSTDTQKAGLVGAGILIIFVLGAVFWYTATHPAPTSSTASSTPLGVQEPETYTTQTIVDNGTYYEVTAKYPGNTPLKKSAGAQLDAKAVAIMKSFAENTIAAFKERGNFANLSHDDVQMLGLDQRKYSLDIDYRMHVGLRSVSYVFVMVEDTGGAHPNTYFRTFTFDTRTGNGLTLGDLFTTSAPYLEVLSTTARAELPKVIGDFADDSFIESGTIPEEEAFQNWYLEGTNLVFVFPPYQVAPYAAGTQTLPIPLTRISSLLRTQYK